jgi:hypothetical protein
MVIGDELSFRPDDNVDGYARLFLEQVCSTNLYLPKVVPDVSLQMLAKDPSERLPGSEYKIHPYFEGL